MNPGFVVLCGLGLVGTLCSGWAIYNGWREDQKQRLSWLDEDLTPTRTQCATCLLDVAKCRCLWRRLRGDT